MDYNISLSQIQITQNAKKASQSQNIDFDHLIRTVDSKVGKLTNKQIDTSKLPYSKLYTYASKNDKILLYVGIISAIIAGIGLPSFIFILGDVMDTFSPNVSKLEGLKTIRGITLYYLYIGLAIWLFSYLFYGFLIHFAESVSRKTRLNYLRKILEQDATWFDTHNYQEIPSKMNQEILSIQKALGEKAGVIYFSTALFLAGMTFGLTKGWNLGLCVLAATPILMIMTMVVTKQLQAGFEGSLKAYGQSAGYAEQALNAIKVVTAFGQQQKEEKNYTTFLQQSYLKGLKSALTNSFGVGFFIFSFNALMAFGFFIGMVFIYYKLNNPVYDRIFSGGDVISCFFGILFGAFGLGMIAPNMQAVTEGKAAACSTFEICDRIPEILTNDPKALKTQIQGKIEFRNVDFYYPSRPDQKILDNFSFEINPGETIALVGSSGSGKSTIIQLLERFYDASQGQVLIDGHDIKTLNLQHFRQQVGYVSQEPALLNTTIKQNVMLGKPDATDEQIRDALKKSRAMEFIQKFPENIDLSVGNAGGQLSGGQKQRIAIARAFIKKPKILLLDEATSALDRKNEYKVQQAIDEIKKDLGQVTTIMIAHRLTTVKNADRIMVMNKGKIVEVGNHKSLLENYPNGIYSSYVKKQQEEPQNTNFNELDSDDEKMEPAQLEKVIEMTNRKDSQNNRKISLELLEKQNEADAKDKQIELDTIPQKPIEMSQMLKRLQPFNKPVYFVVLGLFFSVCQGAANPILGVLTPKSIFNMNIPDSDIMWQETRKWVLAIFGVSLSTWLASFIYKYSFGRISQGIIKGVRQQLYKSVLTKQIGWFDLKDNAPGILTASLSSDVQTLNGVSQEGIGILMEIFGCLGLGLALALYFCWQITLVSLAIFPFLAVSGMIQGQIQAGFSSVTDKEYKEANLLASDSIMNYKTIQSFGNIDVLIEQFSEFYKPSYKKAKIKAHSIGFFYGLSQFVSNVSFGVMFWLGMEIANKVDTIYMPDVLIAVFCIFYASLGTGQASQFGPNMSNSKIAGQKIFKIIDTKSLIDPYDQKGKVCDDTFAGLIEFKEVWFRYPTRKNEWIFRGLNLKINPKQSIAIVGESGCGKSTLANLILRFYDPDFGSILIDGLDIKDYNLQSLRLKMGYVQQEPILFNYSIKENILYGDSKATNSKIIEATQVANAMEFIEISKLQSQVSDDPEELIEHYEQNEKQIKDLLTPERYERQLLALKELLKKQQKEGKFSTIQDILDDRSQDLKDLKLDLGFDFQCGMKGSRLSGGQKQRIAIARAVIRNPSILILDEATSALDEESQTKVQKALTTVMQNRTSIIIAHRLTTIEKCDRLAIIQDGKVVEEGSFNSLNNNQNSVFKMISQGLAQQKQK